MAQNPQEQRSDAQVLEQFYLSRISDLSIGAAQREGAMRVQIEKLNVALGIVADENDRLSRELEQWNDVGEKEEGPGDEPVVVEPETQESSGS